MDDNLNKNLIKKFSISLKEKLLLLSDELDHIKRVDQLEEFSNKFNSSIHTLKGGAAFLGLREYTEFFYNIQNVSKTIENNICKVKFIDLKNLYGYIIGFLLDDIKHWKIERLDSIVEAVISKKISFKKEIKINKNISHNQFEKDELYKIVLKTDENIKKGKLKLPECLEEEWKDLVNTVL